MSSVSLRLPPLGDPLRLLNRRHGRKATLVANPKLVSDEHEMGRAAVQIGAIDSARRRASVAERYDFAVTATGYERESHRVVDVGCASAALAAHTKLDRQRRAKAVSAT